MIAWPRRVGGARTPRLTSVSFMMGSTMRRNRGIFRFEEALDRDGELDPLDLPVLTAEVFELMLRRSGVTSSSTREYLSHPEAWPLAGFYDEAILHLVVRTSPVGGTPKVYLYIEDSSDGTNWYIIDTQTLTNPADGVYRYVVPRPFAVWVRVRMVIEKTAGGAGLAAYVLCRGLMSFVRRTTAEERIRSHNKASLLLKPSPEMGLPAARSSRSSCGGSGEGCDTGCDCQA